jgi:8-oxo-dGTP diphosphatase
MARAETAANRADGAKVIRIAAGVIMDDQGQTLLVRKRGTEAFIQPGGKIQQGEDAMQALRRELREELKCSAMVKELLGQFSAPAVNEPEHIVEAMIYRVEIDGEIEPAAEIAEMRWVDPANPGDIEMAPLTRDHVMGLALAIKLNKSV